jgi:hypothetical protein
LKTQLLPCLVVFCIMSAYGKAGVNKATHLYHPAAYRVSSRRVLHKSVKAAKSHFLTNNKQALFIAKGAALAKSAAVSLPARQEVRVSPSRTAALDSITQLLRLKMYLDPYDYDDIVIGFNAGATSTYNYNNDSAYLPGIDAAEGLASYSSDGVALSINLLPLPKSTPDVIRLEVQAQQNWQFTMMRTELDPLPKIYELWLVDNFKKDSVDLRTDSAYVFNVNKADTATYGSYRFKVVVRQDPSLMVHLVNFNAIKQNSTAEITWNTQNEENYTSFAVERSTDGGKTFTGLEAITSTGTGSYTYTDKTPPQASDIYRLQMTDLNGTVSYSNPVTLMFGNSSNTVIASNISLYPNPTTSIINIQINPDAAGPAPATNIGIPTNTVATSFIRASEVVSPTGTYNIKIVNTAGTVIKNATSSSSTWQDNVAALSPGTYIITVADSNNNPVGHTTFVKL